MSTDLSKADELEQDGKNIARLLDASVKLGDTGDMVCFQSYPRSGNTFLRGYLESVTGVFTGSDMSTIVSFSL